VSVDQNVKGHNTLRAKCISGSLSLTFVFGPFDLLKGKTEQHNIRQNNTWQTLMILNNSSFYTMYGA